MAEPPPPAVFWRPAPHHVHGCALAAFVRHLNARHAANLRIGDQHALHAWTLSHPAAFWYAVAHFTRLPLRRGPAPPVDPSLPRLLRSFRICGTLNFAEAVLRHRATRPSRPAILHAAETGPVASVSFAELADVVARLAAALRRAGVKPRHSVAGVVSNTPAAVAAMLAAAAVGAVWSSCAPDFGAPAIVSRLSQTAPVLLFYSPSYEYKATRHSILSKIAAVVRQLPSVATLVALPPESDAPETRARHYAWREFTASQPHHSDYHPLEMSDPLVTMFSSGTTGAPKCIVQGPGILLNQVKEHVLHLDISPSSVVFYVTSTAWMLFNWLVACLASGATILLYDGAPLPPSDPARLVTLAAEARVTHFGAGAKYFHALSRHVKPTTAPPVPTLSTVMATGSPSTLQHFQFVSDYFGHVQYVSMSGGTEINGCFALGSPWMPVVAPQLQCAGLGMDVAVFSEGGQPVRGVSGELVCRNACPCMPLYFAHDKGHKRYRSSYFAQFGDDVWSHGDFAVHTSEGGFIITGRSDSTLNPGGVRIGTADIYQVVEKLHIVDAALVAEQPVGGDTRIVMLLVLCDGSRLDDKVKKNIAQVLRKRLSPRHVPHAIVQVPQIPYTFSGKKCEIPVKRLLQGRILNNREAVKNPEAFDEIRHVLEREGLLPSNRTVAISSKL